MVLKVRMLGRDHALREVGAARLDLFIQAIRALFMSTYGSDSVSSILHKLVRTLNFVSFHVSDMGEG